MKCSEYRKSTVREYFYVLNHITKVLGDAKYCRLCGKKACEMQYHTYIFFFISL